MIHRYNPKGTQTPWYFLCHRQMYGLRHGCKRTANVRTCITPLEAGMEIRTQYGVTANSRKEGQNETL